MGRNQFRCETNDESWPEQEASWIRRGEMLMTRTHTLRPLGSSGTSLGLRCLETRTPGDDSQRHEAVDFVWFRELSLANNKPIQESARNMLIIILIRVA